MKSILVLFNMYFVNLVFSNDLNKQVPNVGVFIKSENKNLIPVNITSIWDFTLNHSSNVFLLPIQSEPIMLTCEAKCPIHWQFHPSKLELSPSTLNAFDVKTSRKANLVSDESTFIYKTNLTINSLINQTELTGHYKCECIKDPNTFLGVFLYWADNSDGDVLINSTHLNPLVIHNVISDSDQNGQNTASTVKDYRILAEPKEFVSICCTWVNDTRKQNAEKYKAPITNAFYMTNEATYSLIQPLLKKVSKNIFEKTVEFALMGNQCSIIPVPEGLASELTFRVILCTTQNESRALGSYIDFSGERNLYEPYDLNSSSTDLAKIQLPTGFIFANTFFEKQLGSFICSALVSHFSEGIYWITEYRNGTKTQVEGDRKTKLDSSPPLYTSHYTEPMELDIVKIYCYVPNWKSSNWTILSIGHENFTVRASIAPSVSTNGSPYLAVHKGDTEIELSCTMKTIAWTTISWWFQGAGSDEIKKISSRDEFFQNVTTLVESYKFKFRGDADMGNYTCKCSNYIREDAQQTFVVTHKAHKSPTSNNPKTEYFYWKTGEVEKSIQCEITGDPLPQIVWKKNNKVLNSSDVYTIRNDELQIAEVSQTTQGNYSCHATNPYGNASRIFEIMVEETKENNLTSLLSILGALVFATITATLLFFLVRRFKHKSKVLFQETVINRFDGQVYLEKNGQISPASMRYDYLTHEINAKDYIIGDAILGNGNFGTVKVGLLSRKEKKIRHLMAVAIKIPLAQTRDDENASLTSYSSQMETQSTRADAESAELDLIESFESVMSELKVLAFISSFGTHPNIIQFYGACTENIQNGQVHILMELCQNGNLKKYLESHQLDFVEENSIQLAKWCLAIAQGLLFLQQYCLLHMDLAARNILLTLDLVPKICDFGLARQLRANKNDYVKRRRQQLPAYWMSMEALKESRFSIKSDVWSFGITMWEIYSLGLDPGVAYNCDPELVYLTLQRGVRLPKPLIATTEIYDHMGKCWKEDPSLRPTVASIRDFFENLLRVENSNPMILPNVPGPAPPPLQNNGHYLHLNENGYADFPLQPIA